MHTVVSESVEREVVVGGSGVKGSRWMYVMYWLKMVTAIGAKGQLLRVN